jgi:Leucine-rich repeat (LRR) protein
MPKLKIFLLSVVIFGALKSSGQSVDRLYGALAVERSHEVAHDDDWINSKLQEDSLIIDNVRNAGELELIIKRGLQKRVYAIEINNYLRPDLPSIFKLLTLYPNLKYLKIIDRYGSGNNATYNLPIEITKLKQLQGIEFSFIDKLDMNDAIIKISALRNLHTLIFHDYRYELPKTISAIPQIKTVWLNTINISNFDLSKGKWQAVHLNIARQSAENTDRALNALSAIKSLRKLTIQNSRLDDTKAILKFRQLTDLYIEGWNVNTSKLINKVCSLTQLSNLSLLFPFDSTFTLTPLKSLKNLKSLTLNNQFKNRNFEEMKLIGGFKNLETLALLNCGVTELPDIFNNLKALKRVVIRDNHLTNLPPSLFTLPTLEVLDLSNNHITQLPLADAKAIPQLKLLDLHNNELVTLPPAITQLYRLEKILVWGNKLQTLPSGWQNLNKLNYADFSENALTGYPPGLQNNHSVEYVSLTQNKIALVPEITTNGFRLKSLILDANPITALFENIGRYTQLERLNTYNAKLQSLPQSLGDCKKLKCLVLDKSIIALAKLPEGLKDAKELSVLGLNGNPLLDKESIFAVIFSTPRKNFSVHLSENGIEELPATRMWGTTPFYALYLNSNKLKTLPLEFSEVKVLTTMALSNNFLPGNANVYYSGIKTKEDIRRLFKAINITLPE